MVVLRFRNWRAAMMTVVLVSASMLPAIAWAYTAEQEQACSGDALRLCSAEIPDVERITACMARHRAELSPPCQAQFASPPEPGVAADPPDGVKPAKSRKSKSANTSARPPKSKKPARADSN
jgi:hypothetical protein